MIEMILYALIAPWGLAVLTSVWHYPAVLEEVVKWMIVRWSMVNGQWSMKNGSVVGLAFGMSEAVLFSMNSWVSGDWSTLVGRVLLTVPMHTVTGGIVGYSLSRGWTVIGVLVAMLLHAGFNLLI